MHRSRSWARRLPAEDEEDDESGFRADLDELFGRDAELFRRLAQ